MITLGTSNQAYSKPLWQHAGQTLICADVLEGLSGISNESVQLVVTSPPYPGVPKMWGELFAPDCFEQAHQWLDQVWMECLRVLAQGCVLAIVVANTGRRPYLRNNARIARWAGNAGLLDEGEIIWNKRVGQTDTAWGSWLNPSAVALTDNHEYVLIFRKAGERNVPTREPVIAKKDFLEFRKSIWVIGSESAKRTKHIAPFPEEIPERLITLYSFEGETVLDPFVGRGTTLIVAKRLKRCGIGIDHNRKYIELAKRNLAQYVMEV